MSLNCNIKQIEDLLDLKPSSTSIHELRFGKKGSLTVNLNQNTWFDFEAQTGGGMLDFIVHQNEAKDRPEAAKWLERHDLIAPSQSTLASKAVERAHIYRDQDHHSNKPLNILMAHGGNLAGTRASGSQP